jgi:subtilisin-like proprotein convertase family protein
MTLFNWGESPRGKWKLMIETKNDENYGQIDHFSLIFFGSKSNKDSKSKQEERSKRSDELKLKKAFVPSESLIKKIYYDELDLSRKAKIETKQNV